MAETKNVTAAQAREALDKLPSSWKLVGDTFERTEYATLAAYIDQTEAAQMMRQRTMGEKVTEEEVKLACRKYYNSDFPVYAPHVDAMRAALESFAAGRVRVADGNLHWALEQGGILADWCNQGASALRGLMGAYEHRIRSDCKTPDDIQKAPWRCMEFVEAERALANKPHAVVIFDRAAPEPPE